ncbi:MAG: hypothetical protein MRY79_07990 [Alphaproteobacteria bacterium]|nr:hypothetical protein [Alphaproteobacteria bacterium]
MSDNIQLHRYRLDRWLNALNIWREDDSHRDDLPARKSALKNIDFSTPFVLTASDYDEENSLRLVTAKSETSYDPHEGILEDSITYWRHMPFSNAENADQQKHHVISIRAKKVNSDDEVDGIPILQPEQIWVSGELVFCRLRGDDPTQEKHVSLINRITELSCRVKEHLNQQKPARDLAKILAGDVESENALEDIAKGAKLSGLDSKGGFQPSISPFFLDSAGNETTPLTFSNCDLDQLKTILGFNYNTLESDKHHTGKRYISRTQMQSGIKYSTAIHHDVDKSGKNHSFRITMEVIDPIGEEGEVPPPFDIARLNFTQEDAQKFTLDSASFMQHQVSNLSSYEEKLNLIGFFQRSNEYFSKREYPPYRDLAARYRLTDHLNKMHTPPPLEEGGQTLFLAINGSSFEKKVDSFGADIGGGNMVMHRGLDQDGNISEVSVIIDFPFASGRGHSDFDGMNPDYLEWWDSVEGICITHDHYDHATVEYYAHQGFLRGKTIYATEAVQAKMKEQIGKLQVPKNLWPKFETIEGDGAFCLKDKQGNNRLWVQYCEDSTLHSARTTGYMVTGCYQDKHYDDTHLVYGDGFDLTEKGWEWVKRGPRALADQLSVTASKVKDKIIDVVWHDPTGIRYGGSCPRPDDVKETLRSILDVLKDKAVIAVPFSTNHLEIQSLMDVWSEEEYLRNFTAVGANAQKRLSIMNKHGVDHDMDCTEVTIPHDKLPDRAYKCVIKAIEDCIKRVEQKYETSLKHKDISQSKALPFYKKLLEQAQTEIKNSNTKPEFLYQGLLDGGETISADIDTLGNSPEKVTQDIERLRRKLKKRLNSAREKMLKKYQEEEIPTDSSTKYFMIRRLASHGKVCFLNNGLNARNMYRAIMAGQDEAAIHAGRDTKTAHGFRKILGKLGIISTAPTGSAEESFGSLPRLAWFNSLFDSDPSVRNTGYPIDVEKDAVLFVMQPAPPGSENGQERLMQELVNNRNVTIFCAVKNGFKIYNPKELHGPLTHQFKKLGWNVSFDHATNQIQVHDQPFHIHGHGFRNDVENLIKNIPAKLHETIHIPDQTSHEIFKEVAQKNGKASSIESPDDHIAYQFIPAKDGKPPRLKITDHLPQSFWLIRLRRQYGRQYGGIVEMLRAIVNTNKGNKRNDGLDVRRSGEQDYTKLQATRKWSDFLKPIFGGQSARQRIMGPAEPQKQSGNNRPTGRIAFRPLPQKVK